MTAVPTREIRKRIGDNFNSMFSESDHREYAQLLGVSERTARRLRTNDYTPQTKTAEQMLNAIRLHALAATDEAEFAWCLEEARQANEEKQLESSIERLREEGICSDVPRWFARAQRAFEDGQYEITEAILVDRLAPNELSSVEPALLPYAHNRFGLALQYRGRFKEAKESFEAALRTGVAGHRPRSHIAWFSTNLAGVLIRLGRPEESLARSEAALRTHPNHVPAYYVGLCAVDAERNLQRLALWIGRMIEAVERGLLPPHRLQAFLDRAETDPDLGWARTQSLWAVLVQKMQSAIYTAGDDAGQKA